VNHFKLFGLPQNFELDIGLLTERYRDLQRTFHPDKFTNTSAFERRLSVQRSAQINEAFHILKQPVDRARYLLELYGVEMDEGSVKVGQEFLIEQMELRERLAEICSHQRPFEALTELTHDIRHRTETILERLDKQFHESSQNSLLAARENINKLMFLNKIQREAGEIEDDLGHAVSTD